MSLIASVVLFKWLENTAIVRLPFGKFGGSIAGFIGVFLILQNSYGKLATQSMSPTLDVPAGYEAFISEYHGIGFAYPNEYKLDKESNKFETLGLIRINAWPSSSNILFGVEPLQGDVLEDKSEEEARKYILDSNVKNVSKLLINSQVERHSYSINAINGERQVFRGKFDGKEAITIQIIIPNFKKQAVYAFNLTSSSENLKSNEELFYKIMSTVKFF
jgi:hypothetical protein